jgi:hypothetical protein
MPRLDAVSLLNCALCVDSSLCEGIMTAIQRVTEAGRSREGIPDFLQFRTPEENMFRKLALFCLLTFATTSPVSAQSFGYFHSNYSAYHHYSQPSYSRGYRVVPVYYRVPIYIIPAKPACGCEAAASAYSQPASLYAPPAHGLRLAPIR